MDQMIHCSDEAIMKPFIIIHIYLRLSLIIALLTYLYVVGKMSSTVHI